jgi:LacI family transcriptional regulator
MGDRRPTIYDVARVAGVAASTVSRAYARPGRVNHETAQAIFAAAEQLGYRSTKINSSVGRRTGTVALIVSDITNPFYGEIIKGAEEAARLAGYVLLLVDSSESGLVERDDVARTLELVEGVVLASTRMSDSSIRMIAKQTPLVLLNRQMPDTSCIVVDNALGMRRAAEHLASLGHSAIVYVSGPQASWAEGVRWRAVKEAANALELRVRRIDPHDTPSMRTGFRTARQIAEKKATAVLAYNDALAVGIIKGLKQLGLAVPGDFSVVGFDNTVLAEVVDPALTTVVAPIRKAGAAGVGNVLALASGAKTKGETLMLPVKLVVRASTGPKRSS